MITLVTGANAGIGRETAAALASAKHTVVLAGRRPAAVAEAVAEITARPGIDARVRAAPAPLDLASPASVAAFAGALAADLAARGERLGALVNNAGIAGADAGGARPTGHNAGAPDDAWPVADPLMATNAVGTHAVTRLLLPLLLEGAAADASVPRVVTLSSRAHRSSPPLHPATALAPGAGWPASSPPPDAGDLSATALYARSKLANALFAAELARRINGDCGGGGAGGDSGEPRLLSVAVSPGFIKTALASSFAGALPIPAWAARALTAALAQPPAKGARTSVWAVTAPPAAVAPPPPGHVGTTTPPGFSFAHASRPAPHLLSAQARDAALAAALFEATEAVIAGAGVALPPL